MNIIAISVAALIPMALGFVWYHKAVFGSVWQRVAGLTDEQIQNANMGIIFGVSLILAFVLGFGLNPMVIHQFGVQSLLVDEPGFLKKTGEAWADYNKFMEKYGDNFRTFKHGAFHGLLFGIVVIFPVLMTNALFERKGWKYGLINGGYWAVCLTLMGGVISAWK